MMLDESTCFFVPDGATILSSNTVGRATDSYPGMVWLGLKATRIIGLIAEKRLQIFLVQQQQSSQGTNSQPP